MDVILFLIGGATLIGLCVIGWGFAQNTRARRAEKDAADAEAELAKAYARIASLNTEIGPLRAFKRKVDSDRMANLEKAAAANRAKAAAKRAAPTKTTKSGRGAAR